jgi:hypothetical protein
VSLREKPVLDYYSPPGQKPGMHPGLAAILSVVALFVFGWLMLSTLGLMIRLI